MKKIKTKQLILGGTALVLALLVIALIFSVPADIRRLKRGYWLSDGETLDLSLSFSGSTGEFRLLASGGEEVVYRGSAEIDEDSFSITDEGGLFTRGSGEVLSGTYSYTDDGRLAIVLDAGNSFQSFAVELENGGYFDYLRLFG